MDTASGVVLMSLSYPFLLDLPFLLIALTFAFAFFIIFTDFSNSSKNALEIPGCSLILVGFDVGDFSPTYVLTIFFEGNSISRLGLFAGFSFFVRISSFCNDDTFFTD